MHLRRAFDKSGQRLQYLRISIGVVGVGVLLVVPQTDRNYIHAASTGESDFVQKTILLAKQRKDIFFKCSRVIGEHTRFQMDRDIACKHGQPPRLELLRETASDGLT